MIIIGITGTLGAGKGTVVDYLVKEKGFKHFSVRGLLTKLIEKDGKIVNRDSMVETANKLRATHGPSYLVEELFKEAQKSNENCVIESIRTEGEVNSLRKKGEFYLFAVDADPKRRYERIALRGSETDNVSFEKFLKDEEREMRSSDPSKQNLHKCMLLSDYKFDNNGSIKSLYEKVEKVIDKIKK